MLTRRPGILAGAGQGQAVGAAALRAAAWVAASASLVVGVLACPSNGHAASGEPVASIDQFPLRQILYQFPDRGPVAPVEGSVLGEVRTSYFATFVQQGSERSSLFVDLEGARFDVVVGYDWTDRLRVGFDLPLLVYYDGVLDSVVETVDQAVGTPSPQRKAQGRNRYRFHFERDGRGALAPSPGHFGLGDVALEARFAVLRQDESWLPDLGVSGVVEVPSGDAGLAHGNGAVDLGIEAEAGRTLGDFRVTLALALLVPGDPSKLPGVDAGPAMSALVAVAYEIAAAWDVVTQVDYRQSAYDGSDLGAMTSDASELGVGLRWQPPDGAIAFDAMFVEGLINGTSPDFSTLLSLSYRFGEDSETRGSGAANERGDRAPRSPE